MAAGRELKSEDITAIAALFKAGKSNKQIATITGIKLRTVQLWSKKIREHGGTGLPTHKKRPGKKPLTSSRTLQIIKRQLESNPKLTARQVKEQNPSLLGQVSTRTGRRRIHDDRGFRSRRAVRKPLLSPRNIQNRAAFCRRYVEVNEEFWKHVLWSDEATFSITSNRGVNVYRRPGVIHCKQNTCNRLSNTPRK